MISKEIAKKLKEQGFPQKEPTRDGTGYFYAGVLNKLEFNSFEIFSLIEKMKIVNPNYVVEYFYIPSDSELLEWIAEHPLSDIKL